jgi:hypothetical protein
MTEERARDLDQAREESRRLIAEVQRLSDVVGSLRESNTAKLQAMLAAETARAAAEANTAKAHAESLEVQGRSEAAIIKLRLGDAAFLSLLMCLLVAHLLLASPE